MQSVAVPPKQVAHEASHAVQVEMLVWAVDAENVPAAHGVQSVDASLPSVVRYVPASQSWHASAREAPEAWPYLPLAHKMHEEMEFAPVVVENEPPAQGTQTFAVDAPSTEEYVPAAQKIQSASA